MTARLREPGAGRFFRTRHRCQLRAPCGYRLGPARALTPRFLQTAIIGGVSENGKNRTLRCTVGVHLTTMMSPTLSYPSCRGAR
jgi:hypothetical protein